MSVLGEVERAAEIAVPPLRGARLALNTFLALLAAGAVGFVVWWVFIHPGQQATAVAQGKVDATLGKASGDIATGAIPQINDATRQKVEVDVRVQKGMIDVRQAPDASVSARGVSDATLRAVCLLDHAPDPERAEQPVHEDPACERFARSDAGGGQGPD